MRAQWIAKRRGGPNVTQMHHARRGVVTEEMAHVAAREKLEPELVRHEVARGRMVIPANVKHPELEPIGIGVAATCKINANIGNSAVTGNVDERAGEAPRAACVTAPTRSWTSPPAATSTASARRSSTPARPHRHGADLPGLAHVKDADDLTPRGHARHGRAPGEAGRGLHDHPRRRAAGHRAARRGPRHRDRQPRRLAHGALDGRRTTSRTRSTRTSTSCARSSSSYDVTFSLGDGLRPGCLADANDEAQFAELNALGELTQKAWEHGVQVMIEGPGPRPDAPDQDERGEGAGALPRGARSTCSGRWSRTSPPATTTSPAPSARRSRRSTGRRCSATSRPRSTSACPTRTTCGRGSSPTRSPPTPATSPDRPGARDRDDALSRARFEFDWNRQFELSLDPDTARTMHDETLPQEVFKSAKFCSMCGPKFCSMRIHSHLGDGAAAGRGSARRRRPPRRRAARPLAGLRVGPGEPHPAGPARDAVPARGRRG